MHTRLSEPLRRVAFHQSHGCEAMASTGAAQAAPIWGLPRVDCVPAASMPAEVRQRSKQYIFILAGARGHGIERAGCARVSRDRSRRFANNRSRLMEGHWRSVKSL